MADNKQVVASNIFSELERLGIKTKPWNELEARKMEDFPAFYGKEFGSWDKKDPGGDLDEISDAKWFILNNVEWKIFEVYESADEQLHFMKAPSENIDTLVNNVRHLIVPFAMTSDQHYFAIDLLHNKDLNNNSPAVFKIDHDGTDLSKVSDKFEAFLERFKRSDKTAAEAGL